MKRDNRKRNQWRKAMATLPWLANCPDLLTRVRLADPELMVYLPQRRAWLLCQWRTTGTVLLGGSFQYDADALARFTQREHHLLVDEFGNFPERGIRGYTSQVRIHIGKHSFLDTRYYTHR